MRTMRPRFNSNQISQSTQQLTCPTRWQSWMVSISTCYALTAKIATAMALGPTILISMSNKYLRLIMRSHWKSSEDGHRIMARLWTSMWNSLALFMSRCSNSKRVLRWMHFMKHSLRRANSPIKNPKSLQSNKVLTLWPLVWQWDYQVSVSPSCQISTTPLEVKTVVATSSNSSFSSPTLHSIITRRILRSRLPSFLPLRPRPGSMMRSSTG